MTEYLIRRVLGTIPVVLGVWTIVFAAMHLAPGDPLTLLMPPDAVGSNLSSIAAQLKHHYGLDQPLYVQYWRYLVDLLHGNLGRSIQTNQPIIGELAFRYPNTLQLAVSSFIVAVIIGVPAGIVSAVRKNTLVDKISIVLGLSGVSIPNFWLGLLLMLLFALKLGWLPPSGQADHPWSLAEIRYMVMPAITIGTAASAILMRLTRSAMLEILNEDFIRTARSKGLPERVVIYRHALRNAMIPVVTVMGLQFGGLLAGAVVTETVFSWPGIGLYTVNAITGHDYPVVQACVLLIATTFILANLVVDILYAYIDPRISYN